MFGRLIRHEWEMFKGVRDSFAEVRRYARENAPGVREQAERDEQTRKDSAVLYWRRRYDESKQGK